MAAMASLAYFVAIAMAALSVGAHVFSSTKSKVEYFTDVEFKSTKHKFLVTCGSVTVDTVTLNDNKNIIDSDWFRCNNRSNKYRGNVVFVIGGPYATLGKFPDPYVATFMVAGYNVFVPKYSGTLGNTVASISGINANNTSGGGELAKAAEEIALLEKWVDGMDRSSSNIIAGESAGGYISTLACTVYCMKRLLLISPLMQSPADLWKNYASKHARTNIFYSYNNGSNSSNNYNEEAARLASIGFYGGFYQHTPLVSILKNVPLSTKISGFIGDNDPRIGVHNPSGLPAIQHENRVEINFYPDNDHRIIQNSPHGEEALIKWMQKP